MRREKMLIRLNRNWTSDDCTIGEMLVDDKHECYILEDTVREVEGQPVESWKVPGKTAIPRGEYIIKRTMSARFGRVLPLLLEVPGYAGVRIHPGNTAADTEGCLLPGIVKDGKAVLNSRAAFAALDAKIMEAEKKGEEVKITIV
jgi:hypothetical protein